MRLVVTGAEGFLGGHVTELAQEAGHQCLGLVHSEPGPAQQRVELLDTGATAEVVRGAGPGAVIHLAGVAQRRAVELERAVREEVAMARNVLEAVTGLRHERPVLFVGSAAEYGDPGPEPVREDREPAPLSAYGRAKAAAFHAVMGSRAGPAAHPLWARPFNLLGPGQGPAGPVANWARQLAGAGAGKLELRVGSLDVVRDFLHVRDAARALVALAVGEAPAGTVVNVCSGVGVRLGDALDELVSLSGREVSVREDPGLVSPDAPPVVVGDPSRLRALIGPQEPVPLRSALAEVLESWPAAS